jgi:uncharacterized protein DUF4124
MSLEAARGNATVRDTMKRQQHLSPGLATILSALLVVAGPVARAAEAPAARIYSCVDAQGKKHVSQSPIPECLDRDIVQRNSDGSIRGVIRRPPTEKEREAEESKAREIEMACRDRKIEERAHRNLVKRFPDRARHDLARQEAIDDIAKAKDLSGRRIKLLLEEKRRLDIDREFYPPPMQLPTKLKLAIDKNDSALEAQYKLATQQEDELGRINKRFDEELALLQKLWRSLPPALMSC